MTSVSRITVVPMNLPVIVGVLQSFLLKVVLDVQPDGPARFLEGFGFVNEPDIVDDHVTARLAEFDDVTIQTEGRISRIFIPIC